MAYIYIFLTSESDLKKSGIIDRNIDANILKMSMKYIQDEIIDNSIGNCLYERLKELISSGEIELEENSNYKLLLDKYIYDVMVYGVLWNIQAPLNYKTRNKGTIQTSGDNISNADYATMKLVANNYKNMADKYTINMESFLRRNKNSFPELTSCEGWCARWDKKSSRMPIRVPKIRKL